MRAFASQGVAGYFERADRLKMGKAPPVLTSQGGVLQFVIRGLHHYGFAFIACSQSLFQSSPSRLRSSANQAFVCSMMLTK